MTDLRIINLERQIIAASAKGRFMDAARLQYELSELKHRIEEEESVKSVNMMELAKTMSEDDQHNLVVNLHMIFLLSDMIDNACIDINELIRKQDDTCRYEEFNDILKLGKLCRDKIKMMDSISTQHYINVFGNEADNVTKMIRNKLHSILRKTNKSTEP